MTLSEGTEKTLNEPREVKLRCLLVENTPDTADLLELQFKHAGFDVVVAEDGAAGLAEFWTAVKERRLFDLIFTDLAMPHIDGVTMVKRIRSAERESEEIKPAKIVGYTGYENLAETVMTPEDIGLFDDIFKKPDDSGRIPELVNAMLQTKVVK